MHSLARNVCDKEQHFPIGLADHIDIITSHAQARLKRHRPVNRIIIAALRDGAGLHSAGKIEFAFESGALLGGGPRRPRRLRLLVLLPRQRDQREPLDTSHSRRLDHIQNVR